MWESWVGDILFRALRAATFPWQVGRIEWLKEELHAVPMDQRHRQASLPNY
ncbi:hypothetical protein LLH03_18580 [bacterium]|nr:hypothetical protein [bacterium]